MKHILFLRGALLLLLAGASAAGQRAQAQQLPQLSQYMNNNFLFNPAVAGTEDFMEVKFSHRTQWLGLEGAPQTYYATLHTALTGKRRVLQQYRRSFSAVGGLLYSDVTGPTSRTGAYFSFARNIPLTRRLRLALGVSVGMQQFAIDGQKLRFRDPEAGLQTTVAERLPDATVGAWLYSPNYYLGVSMGQILGSRLDARLRQAGMSSTTVNSLQPHYYFTGGLRLPLTPNWLLVPSALVKVTPTATALDLNVRLRYQKVIWAGASLRLNDAAVAMVGVNVSEVTNLTYSYDMGISSLNTYHSGSHEILLGLRLKQQRRPGGSGSTFRKGGHRNKAHHRSRNRPRRKRR